MPRKKSRDLRYREQFFPDADKLLFDVKGGGFVPLPIILRKMMRHVSAPELRVYIYLMLRASKHGVCYPNLDEMVIDLGLAGRKNLLPHLTSLEKKRLISIETKANRRYFLMHDPRVALQDLLDHGNLTDDELFEINELLTDLNQQLLEPTPDPEEPGLTRDQPPVQA